MQVMALETIYQKPSTSQPHPDHKVYPYLLRGLAIERVNQVWCADITYIPMAKGFVYLVAVMDWFSRRVLAWRVSISMDTSFCVEALREALDRYGQPDIFNTDQGAQFTSTHFLAELEGRGIRISMDGKGRYLDNIFIERLWRSLKYEEVYIKAYGSVAAARLGLGLCLTFYNDERPHRRWITRRRARSSRRDQPVDMWTTLPLRCARSRVDHIPTGTTTATERS